MKKRVVIAGLGDTGLLVAMGLYPRFDVTGITPKPALVSGQELGMRVARPNDWRKSYLIGFERYRSLRGMPVRHGVVERVELAQQHVDVRLANGTVETLPYDALVLTPGVSNGFWRTTAVETREQVDQSIDDTARTLSKAKSIAIIGGGVTGVSAASNLKESFPSTRVVLAFSQAELVPGYHPKVRAAVRAQLSAQGVELLANHRAQLPAGFSGERLTTGPVSFTNGQAQLQADVVLWAVGVSKPNTQFLPKALLDDEGFIRVDAQLRVVGTENVFAVGDAAATDPNRSSARNSGFRTVAYNVRRVLEGRDGLKTFSASSHRWGSIFGVQQNGLRVFAPNGFSFRFGAFSTKHVVFPFIVSRGIYGGIDD